MGLDFSAAHVKQLHIVRPPLPPSVAPLSWPSAVVFGVPRRQAHRPVRARCFQGHKLIVGSGLAFALLGWLFFAISPTGLDAVDSGVPDHCGAAAACTPDSGVVVEGNPPSPPRENATECSDRFEAGRAEREADYDLQGEYIIHITMEACPSGCCFIPRWSHVEYTRWFDACIKMFLLTFPALVVGLNESKYESFCYLMIGVLALAYYAFYLIGTFELQERCTAQGHDNLSPQQALHYGNDHVCQQTTATTVMLVWNIVTAIVAIIGGAVAGVLYKPPAAEDYADGKKDKEIGRAHV